jgi:hypothetical protein
VLVAINISAPLERKQIPRLHLQDEATNYEQTFLRVSVLKQAGQDLQVGLK